MKLLFLKLNIVILLILNIFASFYSNANTAEDYVQLSGISIGVCNVNGPSMVMMPTLNIIDTVDKPVGTLFNQVSTSFNVLVDCAVPVKLKITTAAVHPTTKCISTADAETGNVSENFYQICMYLNNNYIPFNSTSELIGDISTTESNIFKVIASQGSYTTLTQLSKDINSLVANISLTAIIE